MSQVVIYGTVGTDVVHGSTSSGHPSSTFRLATNHRFHHPGKNEWVTGPTTWLSVQSYRRLAQNVQTSVGKGDRVVVTGRLSVRDWVSDSGRHGRQVEIIAESIGPDLRFMTCKSQKSDPLQRRIDLDGPTDHPDGEDPHFSSGTLPSPVSTAEAASVNALSPLGETGDEVDTSEESADDEAPAEVGALVGSAASSPF